jgi:integrase
MLETRAEIKRDSIQRYKDTYEHLSKYLKGSKSENLLIKHFSKSTITDFETYLLQQPVPKSKRTLGRNTVNKHLERLRTIIKRAFEEDHISKYPFSSIRLKDEPVSIKYLTLEEIIGIIKLDLRNDLSLDRAKDLFLFGAYTGMRYSDCQAIRSKDLKNR